MAALRSLLIAWLTLAAVAAAPRRRERKFEAHTLEHFEEFCRRFLVLEDGQPFKLEPFQKLILAGFFAGVTEILVLLPKKNGKTTLLAALAIYHLIYTPNAACYIAASSKDQAKIMYQQACGFLERKDEKTGKYLPQAAALQKRILLRKGTKEMRSRRDGGFIWVLSGDVNTADGVIPTLALVDELHRHKDNGQLYGVLHDGLGPRNGQILIISTAGERLKSALGRIRARAYKLPGLKRKGKYTFVRSPNGAFEMHEWALKADDDRNNLTVVKKANPLSSNTIESLAARRASPSMTPSRWARFACGIWMQGEDAAVSSVDWSKRASSETLTAPASIYIGLDIGWRWDTTAVVPGEPYEREELTIDGEEGWWRFRRVRYGKPTILIPPRDGTSLKRTAIIEAVLAFKEQGFEILGVVFDRNAEGESIAQELEDEHGIPAIHHSQDPSPMADASMGLAAAVGAGEIEHPDDDEFTAQILAAKAKTTTGERWRFVAPEQNRGQRKQGHQDSDDVEYVDAAIAAAMLHHTATAPQPPPPREFDLSDYRIRTT